MIVDGGSSVFRRCQFLPEICDAERKAGCILKKMPKAKGGRPKKTVASNAKVKSGRLKNTPNISHGQSKQWQKLANATDEQFEAALGQAEMPTTSGIIKAIEPPEICDAHCC